MESVRIAYFQESGLADLMAGHKVGPILASIKCDYKRQLRYPDTVRISASVVKLGRSSMQMNHLIYSDSLQSIAASGDSTVVVFDYGAQRSSPIPDDVRVRIEQFEGRKPAAS
jgi:acyl-CoA thioester hydrolase